MSDIAYPNAPDVNPDDYLVLEVATCYTKENGEVFEVQALEPIPSGYLEARSTFGRQCCKKFWWEKCCKGPIA